MCGLASTSSLRTSTFPAYFSASFSISGATRRHGPHHSAQKSTITGRSLFRTSSSKVASVTSGTLDDMPLRVLSGPGLPRDLLEESIGLEDAVVREPIEDGAPVAARRHDPGRTEDGEMLAHVGNLAAHVPGQAA